MVMLSVVSTETIRALFTRTFNFSLRSAALNFIVALPLRKPVMENEDSPSSSVTTLELSIVICGSCVSFFDTEALTVTPDIGMPVLSYTETVTLPFSHCDNSNKFSSIRMVEGISSMTLTDADAVNVPVLKVIFVSPSDIPVTPNEALPSSSVVLFESIVAIPVLLLFASTVISDMGELFWSITVAVIVPVCPKYTLSFFLLKVSDEGTVFNTETGSECEILSAVKFIVVLPAEMP